MVVVLAMSCAEPEDAVRPYAQDVDLSLVERRLSEIEKALVRLEASIDEKSVFVSDELPQWQEGTTAVVTLEMLKDCVRLRLARFMTDSEAEEVADETADGITVMMGTLKAVGTMSEEEEDVYLGLNGIMFGCWDPPQSWLPGGVKQ